MHDSGSEDGASGAGEVPAAGSPLPTGGGTAAPSLAPGQTEARCAVETTLAAIGGKWKPILLYHLTHGLRRYSALQRLVPRASDRMLTRSLRELEADGLVARAVHAEVPVRVEYTLTDRGRSLVPILQVMSDWGARQPQGPHAPSGRTGPRASSPAGPAPGRPSGERADGPRGLGPRPALDGGGGPA